MSAFSLRGLSSFRLLCAGLALVAPTILMGCSHKDDQASAPGYYTGPMTKPNKTGNKTPDKDQ